MAPTSATLTFVAAMAKSKRSPSPFRQLQAIACLLGLLLFYAPILSATLMSVTGACCTGDRCPIHGSHHAGRQDHAKTAEPAPMNCDHDGHDLRKVNSCSMSGCQTVEQPAVHAHIFVLESSTDLASRTMIALLSDSAPARTIFMASAPPAPPPKSIVS